ncbi:MAG: outer membrane protein transport protein [Gammaproteobacteria bacterium]|jgi:long-chain fatty acid transport protein
MNFKIRKSLLTVAVSGLLAAPVAQATNGYFMHGYGTKEKGVAGAGVAYNHDDALAAATNPAAMAFVSKRVDLGLQIFAPSPRGYTVTGTPPAPVGTPVFDPTTGQCNFALPNGACAPPFSVNPGTVESENDLFLLPHFGWNNHLGQDWTVGIAIYGNGGLNTEYKNGSATLPAGNPPAIASLPGTYGAGTAGVNLEQLFFNLNGSYKVNPKHAFGASLIVVSQRFRAQGLENFAQFSLDPNYLAGNRNSIAWGLGAKVGYQGEVVNGVRVGISYQSKVDMEEFDDYKGLFAEGGDFDVPSTYTLGVSFDVGSTGVLLADYQRIMYTDVKSISNPISRLTDGSCLNGLNNFIQTGTFAAAGDGCLGGSNGAGFGWEDIGIFKVGYMWNAANIDWRLGYSYSDQTIPESETLFNILAPATIKHHVTAGMTKAVGANQEFNLSLMYAPEEQVKGPNPFDGGATTIEIYMSQWDIQAGWAWKF